MAVVCTRCSRVNPAEAYYCYFDGAALAGRTADGPINLGAQPFPSPFVFPNEVSCRNFDQLAMACQQNWKEALAMLKEGFLGSFFGSIGRVDLARAAKDAAAFPDENRGLDELLGKLPSQVLEAPKLRVEPTEINLGQISVGTDRKLDLRLENQGMRLIVGNVTSDVPWLTLGELPGHASKIFEFTEEAVYPIQVRGQNLRARTKPQEGHLVVESNAGNFIVTLKVEVPPIAFGEGILAGALSPRQIAEKSKANPVAAAPFFANGSVAKWFAANGLTYPVQGPTAPGMAGVQQFFEALGLAKAPKIDFVIRPITLDGDPGKVFEIPLEVSTAEKKPVYAYATGDQSWIDGHTSKPSGRTCVIQLRITVPPRPGETIPAKVIVHANGNQRFTIPLTVNVRGVKPEGGGFDFTPVADEAPFAAAESAFTPADNDSPFSLHEEPAAVTAAAKPAALSTPIKPAMPSPTVPMAEGDGDIEFQSASKKFAGAGRGRAWMHMVPAGLLAFAILGVVIRDFFAAGVADIIDPRPRVQFAMDWAKRPDREISNSLMFGLQDISDKNDPKQLTFSKRGQSNSAVFLIDNQTRIFGNMKHGKLDGEVITPKKYAKEASFYFADEKIFVVQHVELLASDPVLLPDHSFKRLYDTCLVKYSVTNQDKKAHSLGFRFLLDTYIGRNDGTPFTVPGSTGLVRNVLDFHDKDVPDYIQALEFPDLKNPGTLAQLNLKLGGKLEAPSRVSLTRYPGFSSKYDFEVPVDFDNKRNAKGGEGASINDDSAIALYWKIDNLGAGKSREFGFTYGVGSIAGLAELSILNPGPVILGSEFSLVALIADAKKDANATIELPPGLELVSGTPTMNVALGTKDAHGKTQPSPVTWRIRASRADRFEIKVRTGDFTAVRVITVNKTSIF